MDEQESRRIYKLLKDVDFLYKLSVEEVNIIMKRFKRIALKKGAVIIKQASAGDSFFVIAEGKLAVWMKRLDRKKVFIEHLFEGDYFGEMSLLTGEKRNATVIAEEESVIYKLSKNDFKRILVKNPAIIDGMSQVVSIRNVRLARESDKAVKKETLGKRMLVFFNLNG